VGERLNILLSLIAAGSILTACGGGGSGFLATDETGDLIVRLADGPVDEALAVVIQVEAVDVRVSGALNPEYRYTRFELDPVRQIDMLDFQDGASTRLIRETEQIADDYDWIRLVISAGLMGTDSWIDTATGRHGLYLPPANSDNLLVKRSFRIPDNGVADLTIDFDLRQSIIPPQSEGDSYVLDPVLRVVETGTAGGIEGTVDPTRIEGEACTPVVYAFVGRNVPGDDIDRIPPEPITEGTVRLDDATGDYRYTLAWLPAGDYTVALTCQGGLDRPDRDDTPVVGFEPGRNASVVSGAVTRIDL
jgi:hypothetical protein